MKVIAWGNSQLLQNYIRDSKDHPFAYCIDNYSVDTEIKGLPIKRAEALEREESGKFLLVVFAVSNTSLQEIFKQLSLLGLRYGKEFVLYSDYLLPNFSEKFRQQMDWPLNQNTYRYATSYTMNSCKNVQTTILGTTLFLEIMEKSSKLGGSIAEVGAYEGGNALCALNFATLRELPIQKYYIFDSFQGFPEPSEKDPSHAKKGAMTPGVSFNQICDSFEIFPQVSIIKGFVPQTFKNIPDSETFSLVFYDADLYQCALDTYDFFWERLIHGGYMLIHDYETGSGGYSGVKDATTEFFKEKKVSVASFSENTMAVIRKI